MMQHDPSRPYAAKSNTELTAISEWLSHQHAAVQMELTIRSGGNIPIVNVVHSATAGASPAMLEYRNVQALQANAGAIGDSYADQARKSAIQMTWILFAIAIVVGCGICALAILG